MRVDELGNLSRRSLPVVDQLSFGDQFPYPGADQVNAEHRAASGSGDDFRRALSLQDLALAVAGQIVAKLIDYKSYSHGFGVRRLAILAKWRLQDHGL